MIELITNNPEILLPVEKKILEINDAEGEEILTLYPSSGKWTHQELEKIVKALEHSGLTKNGATVYLGGSWIGSTDF